MCIKFYETKPHKKFDPNFPPVKKQNLENRKMNVYTPPKPAPLPADFDEFFASLTQAEKELHFLAIEKLGSSYFVQWTHMYRKWKKVKESAGTK
jgi:hypothetical protein